MGLYSSYPKERSKGFSAGACAICAGASMEDNSPMLRKILIIAAVTLATAADTAWPQGQSRPTQSPVFTAEEVLVISRNADLLNALRADPWATRDFLDK